MSHSPLEWLYDRFSRYIEDRRREPRDDVLTALATQTFPNGELPEVIDVVRVATNVFAAGQETTVRLLGTALQLIGERPDLQQLLRERRDLTRHEGAQDGAGQATSGWPGARRRSVGSTSRPG
jgi:cytochrome P450